MIFTDACMNNFYQALFVFIGGGLGSTLRWMCSKIITIYIKSDFPIATLLANVLAVVLFGIFLKLHRQIQIDKLENFRLLLIVGICGGLSTFSTFSFESIQLLKEGKILFFVLNTIISLALCFSIIYMFLSKSKV
jgi:fluoride exporter